MYDRSVLPLIIGFLLYEQVTVKKMKKYEKEYLAMKEQNLQQEDPIERYDVSEIIIIIIAFKGAIRDFLQSPHSAVNCLQHAHSSGLGAIMCKSHATHRMLITCKCHLTCHLVRRDSSAIKFDRVEIAFI